MFTRSILDFVSCYPGYRSRQLRHLQISCCYFSMVDWWTDFFKKAPLLEKISLTFTEISVSDVAAAGRYCPMLRSFEYNRRGIKQSHQVILAHEDDAFVTAIAQGMSQLRHLQLIGNGMTNKGLQAILDGCLQLESLDIRECFNINLDSACGKQCREQIKVLMFPSDAVKGHKVAEDHPAPDISDFMMFDDDDYW